MPKIKVTVDGSSEAVMFSERVTVDDFESEHFRVQLVERLAWAVGDADATGRPEREDLGLAIRDSGRR